MPYTVDNPPDVIKGLPSHAQEIWVSAYNAAFQQYDGNEQKSAATAWTAVKSKYKKENEHWVPKEAVHPHGEHICVCSECGEEISVEADIKCNTQVCPKCKGPMIAQAAGERRESKQEVNMEKLKSVHAEIIQEVGRRNASLDSGRIKKIMALCQELLSSEEPDEEKAKEALKEAKDALAWLKEQAIMRVEDGIKYPADAYAYVPDAEKPSDWKLRLWEDPDKKVTRKQLGAAAAALSPGGFRGQRIEIPKDALSAVKRKIRAEYRKLDIEEDDIPKWVRESKEIRTRIKEAFTSVLTEAATAQDIAKGVIPIRIIQPGFNVDRGRYYSEKAVEDATHIFENTKMYADHPTELEEQQRPERSLRDWVSTLKNTHLSESGNAIGEAHTHSGWLKEMALTLFEQGNLGQLGVSINAVGVATKQKIDGIETLYVESLTKGKSVDFVTEAGAGGQAGLMESSSDDIQDIDLIDLAMFKEARPDLVKIIEIETRENLKQEVKKAMENEERITELEGQIESLTTERDDLKTKMLEAEKERAKAEAQAAIKEAVDKAELPEAAKERLLERFKDAESAEGIEEAIKAEADYIAKLSEAGKVKDLGKTEVDPKDMHKELAESFMRLGYTEEQAEIAAKGR